MISRLPLLLFRTVALFSLFFFATHVGWKWFAGTQLEWADSGDKSGDLIQHYGAGQLWKEGDLNRLYRGFYLGDWINQWSEKQGLTHPITIEHFNYVYGPLIAAVAAVFANVPWPLWINCWAAWILICYALAFALFWQMEPTVRKLGAPAVFLFFGFPSFYYCFIPLQNGTMTLLILISTGLLLLRNLPFSAGLVLSCLFYKPQLIPYLGFFALVIRQWRFAIGLGAGTVAWILLSFLICGVEANRLWLESLRDMTSGAQFQRNTMNISLRGFLITALPASARTWIDLSSPLIVLAVLGGAGWKIHRLARSIDWWRPQHSLYAGLIALTLAMPYTGHYEILLGLPWWLVYLSQPRLSRWGIALACFYWLISLTSISGTSLTVSITSLFTLAFLIGSLMTVRSGGTQAES